ncbi:hypothetical protein LTR49_015368 [Elasticomyces elasticus]|nr:hypothetical protein LTR49_015368 [Elasticomyces elasticus]
MATGGGDRRGTTAPENRGPPYRPNNGKRPTTAPTRAGARGALSLTSGKDLQDEAWRLITARMEYAGVDTSVFSPQRFSYVFRTWTRGVSNDEEAIFRDLLRRPMTVSDSDLAKVLRLNGPIGNDRGTQPEHGKYIHYIRSFTMCAADLKSIVAQLQAIGIFPTTCFAWLEQCSTCAANALVHIRYIGRSKRATAQERYEEDKARTDFYGQFLRVFNQPPLNQLWRRGIDLFEVVGAIGDPVSTSSRRAQFIDGDEQCLVALFDPDTLLNRQPGGFQLHWTIGTSKIKDFVIPIREGRTLNGFNRLIERTTPPGIDDKMSKALATWTDDVRKFAGSKTKDLGLIGIPFNKEKASAILSQARPSVVDFSKKSPANVFLVLGGSSPVATLSKYTNHFYSDGRGIPAMLTLLAQAWSTETPFVIRNLHDVRTQLVSKGHLPYLDLRQWPKDVSHADAWAITRDYIGITQTLVVMTCGGSSSYASSRNFADADYSQAAESAYRSFDNRGRLSLQHCHGATTANELPLEHEWFIQLACIDPAYVDTQADSEPALRALFLTLLKADMLLSLLFDMHGRPINVNRKTFLTDVISRTEKAWDKAGGRQADAFVLIDPRNSHGQGYKVQPRPIVSSLRPQGCQVSLTERVDGTFAQVFWTDPNGRPTVVDIALAPPAVPRNLTPSQRLILFSKQGIDFRDGFATPSLAMGLSAYNEVSPGDPTLPGEIIRERLRQNRPEAARIVQMWELCTDESFEEHFPDQLFRDFPETCRECGLFREDCIRASVFVQCSPCQTNGRSCSFLGGEAGRSSALSGTKKDPAIIAVQKNQAAVKKLTNVQVVEDRMESSTKRRNVDRPGRQCGPCFSMKRDCVYNDYSGVCQGCSKEGFECVPIDHGDDSGPVRSKQPKPTAKAETDIRNFFGTPSNTVATTGKSYASAVRPKGKTEDNTRKASSRAVASTSNPLAVETEDYVRRVPTGQLQPSLHRQPTPPRHQLASVQQQVGELQRELSMDNTSQRQTPRGIQPSRYYQQQDNVQMPQPSMADRSGRYGSQGMHSLDQYRNQPHYQHEVFNPETTTRTGHQSSTAPRRPYNQQVPSLSQPQPPSIYQPQPPSIYQHQMQREQQNQPQPPSIYQHQMQREQQHQPQPRSIYQQQQQQQQQRGTNSSIGMGGYGFMISMQQMQPTAGGASFGPQIPQSAPSFSTPSPMQSIATLRMTLHGGWQMVYPDGRVRNLCHFCSQHQGRAGLYDRPEYCDYCWC